MKLHLPVVPVALQFLSPAGLVWRINAPSLYLTFDDGPVPEVTPRVLDILKEYNAKATFFCVGDNVRKHPGLFNRLISEGHSVGNHTFSHLNGIHTDNEEWYNDIEKGNKLINSNLLRPPYGRISYKQVKHLRDKFKIIMWSVLTGDYNHQLTKEQVLQNALKYSRPGSIIVFHDSIKASERMFYALPKVLEHFGEKGYSFKRIT